MFNVNYAGRQGALWLHSFSIFSFRRSPEHRCAVHAAHHEKPSSSIHHAHITPALMVARFGIGITPDDPDRFSRRVTDSRYRFIADGQPAAIGMASVMIVRAVERSPVTTAKISPTANADGACPPGWHRGHSAVPSGSRVGERLPDAHSWVTAVMPIYCTIAPIFRSSFALLVWLPSHGGGSPGLSPDQPAVRQGRFGTVLTRPFTRGAAWTAEQNMKQQCTVGITPLAFRGGDALDLAPPQCT